MGIDADGRQVHFYRNSVLDHVALAIGGEVQHLMLRKDVVAAVAEGKFHVHAVATADEALELVTGRIADVRDHDGHFPVASANAPVEARPLRFADDVRRFAADTERSAAASRVRHWS